MTEEHDVLERAGFFQSVQIWPLTERLDYRSWLANFRDEDKDIAYKLLDFFIYFPDTMVRKMIISSVKHAYEIIEDISGRSIDKNDIYFSYIPGETLNVSDSGAMLLRKVRDIFDINENKLLYVEKLVDKLKKNPDKRFNVIFVDDFIGSGWQASTAWNETIFQGELLNNLFNNSNNTAVFANLVSNAKGLKKIKDECAHLHVVTNNVLGPEYNLFEKECYCWNGDEALFERGKKVITSYCKQNGGNDMHGMYTMDAMGFKKQGLAIAFDHGIPDATSQIFYLKSDTWNPLIKK